MSSLVQLTTGNELGLSADLYDDQFYNFNSMLETGLEPREEYAWNVSLNQFSPFEASSISSCQSSANSIVGEAITTPLTSNPGTPATEAPTTPLPKRVRYKNASPATISRRKAQNRASQRAYRERKEQRIHDLEQLLEEAHRKETTLRKAFVALLSEYGKLNNKHYVVDPRGQIDTFACFPPAMSGSDFSFAHSILSGAIAEDASASERMSLSSLPGELALELLSEDIIIS